MILGVNIISRKASEASIMQALQASAELKICDALWAPKGEVLRGGFL